MSKTWKTRPYSVQIKDKVHKWTRPKCKCEYCISGRAGRKEKLGEITFSDFDGDINNHVGVVVKHHKMHISKNEVEVIEANDDNEV